jgi:vesicle transport protein SEC22
VIQRIRRQFKDPRAQRNLDRVNSELQDVRQIMQRNISEIMVRGEALDGNSVSESKTEYWDMYLELGFASERLRDGSKAYLKDAKKLRLMALYHKYGPYVIVLVFIFLLLLIRWYFF